MWRILIVLMVLSGCGKELPQSNQALNAQSPTAQNAKYTTTDNVVCDVVYNTNKNGKADILDASVSKVPPPYVCVGGCTSNPGACAIKCSTATQTAQYNATQYCANLIGTSVVLL